MRKFLVLALLSLVGCGGSSGPTSGTAQQFTITSGNWDFSGQDQGGAFIVGGNLTQSGAALSGVFHVFNSQCYALNTDVPISGTTTATSASVTSTSVNAQVISASFSGSAASITGTFNISGGCAAGATGSINGTLVPSMSGTWTGSFTSINGPPVVSTTANFTQSTTADVNGLLISCQHSRESTYHCGLPNKYISNISSSATLPSL